MMVDIINFKLIINHNIDIVVVLGARGYRILYIINILTH